MPHTTSMSNRTYGFHKASSRFGWQPPFVTGEIWDERVVLGHGAGGRKMHRLIRQVFLRHFGGRTLKRLEDAAVFRSPGRRLGLSTDSYVVQPLFFPGGDIGKLAVCGTVNDLAVMGAIPMQLSVGFILREGLKIETLERICSSIGRMARTVGLEVVTGDTKVIERGTDEGIYVNTTGVGSVPKDLRLGPELIRPGDRLLINGPIGEHEAAVALARGSYRFKGRIASDCAPLHRLTVRLLRAGGVRMMRDPTRGGLATTCNELADACGLGFILDEDAIPVSRSVRAVADLLGIEPLYMANEGKVLVVCAAKSATKLVHEIHRDAKGRNGRVIGEVVSEPQGVWLRTRVGSLRRLIMLEAEQLPRIC